MLWVYLHFGKHSSNKICGKLFGGKHFALRLAAHVSKNRDPKRPMGVPRMPTLGHDLEMVWFCNWEGKLVCFWVTDIQALAHQHVSYRMKLHIRARLTLCGDSYWLDLVSNIGNAFPWFIILVNNTCLQFISLLFTMNGLSMVDVMLAVNGFSQLFKSVPSKTPPFVFDRHASHSPHTTNNQQFRG